MIFFNKRHFWFIPFVCVIAVFSTSCDNLIYDYPEDCEVTHSIRFVYDMNLKWADAFPSEVKSVNLYVFDNNGVFVKEYQGMSDELSDPSYSIKLDLPLDATYQFLAWCGLDNPNDDPESFSVMRPVAGVTTITEMSCRLKTATLKGKESSDQRLNFLYYGYLVQELKDPQKKADFIYTMYLTKDTNHVRVMLQQVDGNISAEEFDISLSADNGLLSWDNLPFGNTEIEYLPWNLTTDILGVGNSEGEMVEYTGVVADLSSSRFMADRTKDIFLTVRRKADGELLFKVPLLQYALTEKSYYELAYHHTMTDQEFLDRQDEYFMTFFLGKNLDWQYVVIEILQWRLVIHNYEVVS
ncbi:MAG: FimB/Mfa2 family fimbrial subunit [Muribaculaceae bacterium]|nr:FimB/Mfa2 family fimbrial subunit [Muribaculaceae bacterium]